jgi:hypothetical protein
MNYLTLNCYMVNAFSNLLKIINYADNQSEYSL